MLEELDELKDIEGKTVKAVVEGTEQALILFTDGTFICIAAGQEYDSEVLETGNFNHREWHDNDLVKIFGQKQVDIWNKQYIERIARREAEAKEQRRQQYERLKAEFDQ